ncbi:hypothetical protein HQO27_01630 [Rhodococcus fascians]|nr:hypothetical protein [Rhodococcus fascians]MBY4240597.1 hypothetical protein [Rhodococcus fascians]MBY4253450.1 hypothetical protein [Rhodococcus fascians]MBY4269087.1 hypothetical protein [Rhodococcus fascians]MBY4274518.1 hypothetical protein [Rhodococcus fascians]
MIALIAIGIIVAVALWRAGETETGWRFAPLRATGLIAGGVFRIALFVATIVLAFVAAAIGGALRSNF